MQITRTTNDETGQRVYEIEGYPVKVVVEQVNDEPWKVEIEVWDEAGLSVRETRPAEQADRLAIKTLFDEYRADSAEQAVVAEAV